MFRNDGSPLEYFATFGACFAFGIGLHAFLTWYGRYMRKTGYMQAMSTPGNSEDALNQAPRTSEIRHEA